MDSPLAASSLYPVVHDLSHLEYEGEDLSACEVDENGNISFRTLLIKELAVPSLEPRSVNEEGRELPPTPPRSGSWRRQTMSLAAPPIVQRASSSEGTRPGRRQSRHSRIQSDSGLLEYSQSQDDTETSFEATGRFDESYVLTRLIFRCDDSEVWETIRRESGLRYCVKIVPATARGEVELLSAAQSHSSVTSLVEVMEEPARIYIVMEYLTFGNLLTRVVQSQDGLHEDQVRVLARQLLEGAVHLHERLICHNDLQPSNILLAHEMSAKIADFGSASRLRAPYRLGSSPSAFSAPEILQRAPPSRQADMWSIGCLIYFMLFGRPPFEGCRSVLMDSISCGDYSFPPESNVSREAKQLVSCLLHVDPDVRLTAEEALEHRFFLHVEPLREEIKPSSGHRRRSHSAPNRRNILTYLIKPFRKHRRVDTGTDLTSVTTDSSAVPMNE